MPLRNAYLSDHALVSFIWPTLGAAMTTRREATLAVRSLRENLKTLASSTGPLFTIREDLEVAVNAAIQSIVDWEIEQAAQTTLLRDIVPKGTRIGATEAYGIRTVAQASKLNYARLTAMNGVGPQTATAVLHTLGSFPEAVKKQVRLLPNPDRPRPADVALIHALDMLAIFKREVAPALDAALAEATSTQAQGQALLAESGLLRRVFSAERRAGAASEEPKVAASVRDATSKAAALISLVHPPDSDPSEVWRRYSQNNAQYVALLEQHGRTGTASSRQPSSGSGRQPTLWLSPRSFVDRYAKNRPSAGPTHDPSLPTPSRRVPPLTETPPWPSPHQVRTPDPLGGLPPELAAQIEAMELLPGPLVASLRRYQHFGSRFLILRKRAILGDDMGLGKTVQVLAAMCHLSAQGSRHFVVVAPNSVLINWQREVNKHTTLTPRIAHGLPKVRNDVVAQWKHLGGVLITTYGTIPNVGPLLGEVDLLAVDEAHLIKNPYTDRTRAVREVAQRSSHLALLTGTALENRLSELGDLVTFVKPELEQLIAHLRSGFRPDPTTVLHQLAPVYLRRTQRDCLTELPPLTQIIELVKPTESDLDAYRSSSSQLMSLRRAASFGDGSTKAAKFERLQELFDEYRLEGRKVIVFSFFRDVLDLASSIAGGCEQITGDTSPGKRQQIIDLFGETEGFAVLACQVEAGGLGINLQAAQVVILMEPQIKPSTEHQAIARVQRMGQTRNVNVHRMVLKGTVEEYLVELVRYKQQIFDDFADPSSLKEASGMAIDGSSMSLEEELAQVIARQANAT